jgi:exodeoxyribonuclease VII large subunit
MTQNINDLNILIKQSLPKKILLLQAEIRQPKLYPSGHMYLNLKDNYGVISAIVWKYNMTDIIKNLREGDKVELSGKLDFYGKNGKLSFIINEIKNVKGEGEVFKLYNEIKLNFEKLGYFLEEKKRKVPTIIKNILILSSKNGDAIKDFYHCIEHNNILINDTFKNVSVQGVDCPKMICDIIDNLNNNYDLIVITRGGGSFEDLFGFCQEVLIECVYNCKIPILSAVGHKEDTTLLDYVADYVAPTPSLAAQFIVDHNNKYIKSLLYKKQKILELFKEKIYIKIRKIDTLLNKNNNIDFYNNIKTSLYNKLVTQINTDIIKIERHLISFNTDENIKLFSNNKQINGYNNLVNILMNKDDLYILIENKLINIKEYYT